VQVDLTTLAFDQLDQLEMLERIRLSRELAQPNHARELETSTFDIFQGKFLEFLSQPRQIWRG
jgi:hypothetical protein